MKKLFEGFELLPLIAGLLLGCFIFMVFKYYVL